MVSGYIIVVEKRESFSGQVKMILRPYPLVFKQLRWLLDSLPIEQKKAHSEVKSRIII